VELTVLAHGGFPQVGVAGDTSVFFTKHLLGETALRRYAENFIVLGLP
jgi:hypothetical protein